MTKYNTRPKRQLLFRRFALLVTAIFIWAGTVQAQPVVSFSKAKTTVTPGEIFSVDIVMSDFPVSQGGGLTLHYRSSVVQVTGVTVNNATWSFINQPGAIDNEKGKVKDIIFSAFPGVSGDGVIATVEFEAIKKGKTRLRLKESSKNPFANNGEPLAVELLNAVVRVKKPRIEKHKQKDRR